MGEIRKMNPVEGFFGLTMPVFTAFGWAGEENALKFALSQMELFVSELHVGLSREAQEMLPAFGVNQATNSAYLAASDESESDAHVLFNPRPVSLEIQLVLTDKDVLRKGLKLAEHNPARCHRLITELGPEWTLRVQQMQFDEDSGEAVHYQDLFKDEVGGLTEEKTAEVMKKAAYLNGEAQWVTPIFLSRRLDSERVAAMGSKIVPVMTEQVSRLIPLITFLTGRSAKKTSRKRTKPAAKAAVVETAVEELEIEPEEGFNYTATLQPLHIRRGFINLTAEHWPFFAVNSRSTTRKVTVYYDGIYDKENSVWRLVSNDQARLVLSPAVHHWLEDYFAPGDSIRMMVRKIGDKEIQISLKAVE